MAGMGDVERLIVVLEAKISDFEKGMKRAEDKGAASFQKLVDGSYKTTTAIEKQMQATAATIGKSMDQIFGVGKEWASRGAMNSEFRGFIQAKAAVDQLRAAYDPAFAASERFRVGVVQLDAALAKGAITEADHATTVAALKAEYAAAVPVVDAQTGVLGRLGNMSGAVKAKVQGVGFQVQDLAVQMAAGTSASTAMAQQLPQLMGNFGLVGIAIGTLAAVGIPLLGAAFKAAGEDTKDMGEAVSSLKNSVTAMNEIATRYTAEGLEAMRKKYGEVDAALLGLMGRQRQFAMDRAAVDADTAVRSLAAAYDALSINLDAVGAAAKGPQLQVYNLGKELGIGTDRARELVQALQDADKATTFEGKAEALGRVAAVMQESSERASDLTKDILDAEDAMRELAAAVPRSGWLNAAMAEVEALTGKLWAAVTAKGALAGAGAKSDLARQYDLYGAGSRDMRMATNPLYNPPAPPQAPGKTGGGGGGGGGGSSGRVEALLTDLQTERETVEAWNSESLATLTAATDAQLAAIGGRHEAMERLEAEHQDRLRGIRDTSNTGALANSETFFGALATVSAAGGTKLAKVARASAALEAGINVLRAQAQVLADPTLGFWAKLPAMAAIGAAGLKVVGALGGGGRAVAASAATSGTSATASAADTSAPEINITLKGLEPGKLFTSEVVRGVADTIVTEFKKRGLKVGFSA